MPAALEVLGIAGARVKQVTAFAFPELFARFGLRRTAVRALVRRRSRARTMLAVGPR
jgi:hypothetical protein